MKKWFLWAVIVCIGASLAAAQDSQTTAYAWEQGNMALAYPAAWEAPIPAEENGRMVLQLAQAMADSPQIRPPGIPIITLSVIPDLPPETDVAPLLQTEFQALNVQPGDPAAAALIGYDAIQMTGASADGLLFAIGRAAQLPDGRVLMMTGRALETQQEVFAQTYQQVANSLVLGAQSVPAETSYAVQWNTQRKALDPQPFLNLTGLVYGPNDHLYTVDKTQGVVELDARSGEVAAIYPNDQLTSPSAIAVDTDGTIYVADTGCRCLQILGADGKWRNPTGGFGDAAPFSLAYSAGLYATDQTLSGYFVRLFADQNDIQSIALGTSLSAQPLLAVDRTGRVLALTPDGQVLALDNGAATPLFNIGRSLGTVNAFAVDLNNNLVLATRTQGLVVVNSGGQVVNRLGRIVPIFPLAGEVVSPDGVAVGPDGAVYCADSDGTFGALTAFSPNAVAVPSGSTLLTLETPVQGTLNELAPEQSWTYSGNAGEQVTIFASDTSHVGALDVQLTLIAPDGHTEAFDDDQATYDLFSAQDAEISDTLAASGVYTVKVERVSGSGSYSLAISDVRPFDLSADGVTRLDGQLIDALPTQRWTFQGQAGQVLTFTMQATDGSLDSVLRLYSPDGQKLAENDDADDPALGKNSQLVQVQLPASGTYTLEASRYEGEGHYSLVIVETS